MPAIIAGTSLMDSPLFSLWEDLSVETPYGDVRVKTDGTHFFVQRHGYPPLPPHRINHRAHIWALGALKVTEIAAINSVGSLKAKIRPSMFVIPDDFVSLWNIPTFFDREMRFIVPEWDGALRERLESLCRESGISAVMGGVYVQTTGPRLETRAEINLLRRFGDIIGMTMASEATLCMESGIGYASLCSVDNYANGITKKPLTIEQIGTNMAKNTRKVETVLKRFLATETQ
jgi:purine nucleoside phosphorylase